MTPSPSAAARNGQRKRRVSVVGKAVASSAAAAIEEEEQEQATAAAAPIDASAFIDVSSPKEAADEESAVPAAATPDDTAADAPANELDDTNVSGVSAAGDTEVGTAHAVGAMASMRSRDGTRIDGAIARESTARHNAMRRSSLVMATSSLAPAVLQQTATGAGAGPRLAMLNDALRRAGADAGGYVDFTAFSGALSRFLEVDNHVLLQAFFRACKPKVHIDAITAQLNAITHGTLRDAISFAFDCYDTDGDGYVALDEWLKLAEATVVAQVQRAGKRTDTVKLKRQLKELFDAGAHDWGNEIMSRAEFVDFVITHESALAMIVDSCSV